MKRLYIFIFFSILSSYVYADQTFEQQMQMLEYAKSTKMKKYKVDDEFGLNKSLNVKIETRECSSDCVTKNFLVDSDYLQIIGIAETPHKKYEKLMGYCKKDYIQAGLPEGLEHKGKDITKPVSLTCLADNSYAMIVYNIDFSSFSRYKVEKTVNFVVQRPAMPLPILLDSIKIDEDIRRINNLEL